MAKYLDLTGLSAYDTKIKEYINNEISLVYDGVDNIHASINTLYEAVANLNSFNTVVVDQLPDMGMENTIYLVPSSSIDSNNTKDEYLYVSGIWEKIGSTEVNLDGVVRSENINTDNDHTVGSGNAITSIIVNETGIRVRKDSTFVRPVDFVKEGDGEYISDIRINNSAYCVGDYSSPVMTIVMSNTPMGITPISNDEIDALFA